MSDEQQDLRDLRSFGYVRNSYDLTRRMWIAPDGHRLLTLAQALAEVRKRKAQS